MPPPSRPSSAGTPQLPNGLYAVLVESPTEVAAVPSPNRGTILYDPRLADPTSDADRRYVVIGTTAFVPLVLGLAPERVAQSDGRSVLSVTLTGEQVPTLADFTRRHLGDRSALVLDDEIVTIHKIRTVIDGGRMQITRCTDRACDRIYSKLLEAQPHER